MINNDYMAAMALRGLNKSSQVMSRAMEQLSTGNKINRSSDDAAGMGITTIHKAHTIGMNVSIKHASDGMAIVNSIEGAVNEVTDILLRMRELSMQSASDVKTDYDRDQLQKEINQYSTQLNNMSSNIEFNAGHDLNLDNLDFLLKSIPNIKEVSIGHALVLDALDYGLEKTINKYNKITKSNK